MFRQQSLKRNEEIKILTSYSKFLHILPVEDIFKAWLKTFYGFEANFSSELMGLVESFQMIYACHSF